MPDAVDLATELDDDDIAGLPDNLLDDDAPVRPHPEPDAPATTADDQVTEPSAGTSDERPRGPDGKFIAKSESAGAPTVTKVGVSQADSAVAPAAVAPAAPAAFKLPDGAQPFPFKVDNEQVTLDGVVRYPEGVWIPAEAWDRQFVPKYLGSRQRWMQERQQWGQREEQFARQVETERNTNAKLLAEVKTLLEAGPEAMQAWLQEYHTNAPLMLARMESVHAKEQLAAMERERQAEVEDAQAQAMVPRLQQWLGDAVALTVKDTPEFAALGTDPKELHGLALELYDTYGAQLFWEADKAYPEMGIAQGQILVNPHTLTSALQREARRVNTIRSRVLTAKEAEERNKAALASSATASSPASPRQPAGPPAKPAPKKKNDYEAWEEDFDKKPLLSDDD